MSTYTNPAIGTARCCPICNSYQHDMREPNLIELTSTREVSRTIQYLDPDFQANKSQGRRHADSEGLIMLILLLGGVITCFVVMVLHVAE